MNNNKIIQSFFLSLLVTILYCLLVVDFTKEHLLFEHKEEIVPVSSQMECTVNLEPDHYLLKIIHQSNLGRSKEVVFNSEIISAFKVIEKGRKETAYFYIFPEQIREDNSLAIDFGTDLPEKVKIKFQNYRYTFIADSVIAFFRSPLLKSGGFSLLHAMTVFLLSSFFFVAVMFGLEKKHKRRIMRFLFVIGTLLMVLTISNFLPFIPLVVFVSPLFFGSCCALIIFITLGQVVLRKTRIFLRRDKTRLVSIQPSIQSVTQQKMYTGLFLKFFLLGVLLLVVVNFPCLDLPFAYADDWHYLQTDFEAFEQVQIPLTWAQGKPLTGFFIGISNIFVDEVADLGYLRFFSILSLAASLSIFTIWLKSLRLQSSTAFMISAALVMLPGATSVFVLGVQGMQYPAMVLSLISAILCYHADTQIMMAPLCYRIRMLLRYSAWPFLILVAACLFYPPYAMYYLLPTASVLLFKKHESWKAIRLGVIHNLSVFICALPAYYILHRYVFLPLYLLANPGYKNHPAFWDTTSSHNFNIATDFSSVFGKIKMLFSEIIWPILDLWGKSDFSIQTSSGVLWSSPDLDKTPGLLAIVFIFVASIILIVRINKTSVDKTLYNWKYFLQRLALFCLVLLLSILLVLAPKGPTVAWDRVLAAFSSILFLIYIWGVMVVVQSTRIQHKTMFYASLIALTFSVLSVKYNASFAIENFIELDYVRQELTKHAADDFSDIVFILPENENASYVNHAITRYDGPPTTAKVCSALLPVMVGHIFEQIQSDKYVYDAHVSGGSTPVFVHLNPSHITMHGPRTNENPLVIDFNNLLKTNCSICKDTGLCSEGVGGSEAVN